MSRMGSLRHRGCVSPPGPGKKICVIETTGCNCGSRGCCSPLAFEGLTTFLGSSESSSDSDSLPGSNSESSSADELSSTDESFKLVAESYSTSLSVNSTLETSSGPSFPGSGTELPALETSLDSGKPSMEILLGSGTLSPDSCEDFPELETSRGSEALGALLSLKAAAMAAPISIAMLFFKKSSSLTKI